MGMFIYAGKMGDNKSSSTSVLSTLVLTEMMASIGATKVQIAREWFPDENQQL